MQKRKFTKEEKLLIIEESKMNGVKATLEKHGIYPATFYNWAVVISTATHIVRSHKPTANPNLPKSVPEGFSRMIHLV